MRALFFFRLKGRARKGSRFGDVSKGGVWLRRLVTGAIANSPVPGSDSAIAPVAMLARHPLSTMPPDLLPFLALALQDRKKQGRRLRMEFYIRRDEMTQRLGYRSGAHDSTCSDWMNQRGRR